MNTFDMVMNWIFEAEGGYVNNPLDPGGETKFGICKRSYPNLIISNLTLDDARQIYYNDFYCKCHCESMPPIIALIMMDCAVNQGVATAIRLLQKTLKIKEDGIIGVVTLTKLAEANINDIYTYFSSYRVLKYISLSRFNNFGLGWLNRLNKLNLYIFKYSEFFKGKLK